MINRTILSLVLSFFLAAHLNAGIVIAQELISPPPPKPVEYTLPYPGLLPDHPLYFLRALRDTLQELMVSDPVKKAEFYQMQADKSISASQVLSQKKGTVVLAVATAEEALDDYNKAIEAAASAKKQGLDIHEIRAKLLESNSKHIEVLKQIDERVKDSDQQEITKTIQKARDLGKKTKTLLPAK